MTDEQIRASIAAVYKAARTAAGGDTRDTITAISGALGLTCRMHPTPEKPMMDVVAMATDVLVGELNQLPQAVVLRCAVAAAGGDREQALAIAVSLVAGLIGAGPDPGDELQTVVDAMVAARATIVSAATRSQEEPS